MEPNVVIIVVLIVANVLQFLIGWLRSNLFASERDDFEQQATQALRDLQTSRRENQILKFENSCLDSATTSKEPSPKFLKAITDRCRDKDAFVWNYYVGQYRVEAIGEDAEGAPRITLTESAKRRISQLREPSLHLSIHDFSVRSHSGQHVDELFAVPCGPRQVLLLSKVPRVTGHREHDLRLLEQQCGRFENQRPTVQQRLTAIHNDPKTLVELELAREMLELRTITDHDFATPNEMLESFLARLAMLTSFERASLYLLSEDTHDRKLFAWGGQALSPSTTTAWLRAEVELSREHHVGIQESLAVSSEKLSHSDVPFKTALLTPAFQGSEEMGVVMLTSRTSQSPDAADLQLLHWAAEFIMQTLVKTLDRALLADQARRDALTQLANRHAFEQEFSNIVQQSIHLQRDCSLVLIDIDHFKKINDHYGHPAGDAALSQVATRINEVISHLRVTDRPLLARYGGEEFALLLPNIGAIGAQRIAETIREVISGTPVTFQRTRIDVTLSAGVATLPYHAETPSELLSRSDAALYHAKNNGRNRVELASMSSQ